MAMTRSFGVRAGSARGVLGLSLCAFLAGCAVGPDYRAPDPAAVVPARYPDATAVASGPGVPAAAGDWWTGLGAPALDGLEAAALSGNADLAAAEARVAQARFLAAAAGAGYYPQASIDGRVGQDKLSRNGENLALIPFNPPRTEFTDYRVGFDASWELDLFGHTRRQVEAALARAGSAEESRNEARVVIAAEVARGYLEYATAVRRIEVARATEAAYARTAELVTLQHGAGVASDLELNRVRADAIASTSVSPTLDADRRAALFRLASLTGLGVEEVGARLEGVTLERAVAVDVPPGLPADLLRRRPDIRRAERDLAASTADAGVAVAEQFPRVSLVGDFGLDSVHPGELVRSASRYWNVGPQVSLPVFSAGRLHRQSEAAEAGRTASLANYRSVVLAALADVETALVRYAADGQRARALHDALDRVDGVRALTQLRYEAGEATLLEVLDAERATEALGDQAAAADGQVGLDFVSLHKALGGGWDRAPLSGTAPGQ